jgi:hypothetical protein
VSGLGEMQIEHVLKLLLYSFVALCSLCGELCLCLYIIGCNLLPALK